MFHEVDEREAMEKRFVKLERQNHRLIGAVVVALILGTGSLLIGILTPGSQAIEAERFGLRDKSGKSRAVLGTLPDGSVLLTLFDKDGRGRLGLSVDSAGAPIIGLTDTKGRMRLLLNLAPDGTSNLQFLDSQQHPREMLGLGPDERPNIVFLDNAARLVWSAP